MGNRKMTENTEGLEFLNDIKFTVMHALFKGGFDLPKADSIAEAAKEEVYKKFKGAFMYLPNQRGVSGSSRAEVLALHDQGKTVREIIRMTGMSDCTVYGHIRRRNQPVKEPKAPKLTSGLKDLHVIKFCTAKILLRNGIDSVTCTRIGDQLQTFLCKHWGGITFYIAAVAKVTTKEKPHGELVTRGKRAALICAEYDAGLGVAALAEKYDLSENYIRLIIRSRSAAETTAKMVEV